MSIWLQIAAIIATLISPLLAVLLQEKLRRPTASPDINQPNNLSQSRGGRFKRHLKTFLPSYFGIFMSIGGFIWSLYKAEPLTRWDVLFIALFAAGLALNIMSILIIKLSELMANRMASAFGEWRDLVKQQSSDIDSVLETYKEFTKGLEKLSEKQSGTTLSKIKGKIKNLIGD